MFEWLKRTKKASAGAAPSGPLVFRSSAAAFEYACKFLRSDLGEGAFLPAIILDASKEFGTQKAIATDAKGFQTVLLLVCSRDGGFRVMAQSASNSGPVLQVGDLVAWQAMTYRKELATMAPDERFGWMGVVVGTLKPEWQSDIGWIGRERFR